MFEELGKKVRNKRMEIGYTQKRAADLIGINVSYLSKIETGSVTTPISHNVAVNIAQTLGLDIDETIKLTGRMEPELAEAMKRLLIKQPAIRKIIWAMIENEEFATALVNYVRDSRVLKNEPKAGKFSVDMMYDVDK